MVKLFFIAKANIKKRKTEMISVFLFLMLISALITTSLSVTFEIEDDMQNTIDRANRFHSAFALSREMYEPEFAEIIKRDPRVSELNTAEIFVSAGAVVDYGEEVSLHQMLIFNLKDTLTISAPVIAEEDLTIPRESAIYLPVYAKDMDKAIGDRFDVKYNGSTISFIIAGFFETSDLATTSNFVFKYFVPDECFQKLRDSFNPHNWLAVRFHDIDDSTQFNLDFAETIGIELSNFAFSTDSEYLAASVVIATSQFSWLLLILALLITFVSIVQIRFNIINHIKNSMREIGVMKASGYTDRQIILCSFIEYGSVSLTAVLLGVFIPIPLFPIIRRLLSSMTGTALNFGINFAVGLSAAMALWFVILLFIYFSCRKIKKLTPVGLFHGGMTANSFRSNHFSLNEGIGNVHIRLAVKNILAYVKSYAVIGSIAAMVSLTLAFTATVFMTLAVDRSEFDKYSGFELTNFDITVMPHTDADAFAEEIERMPQVRKTLMLDVVYFEVENRTVVGNISSDFSEMEMLIVRDGRAPIYDNEAAIPGLLANQLGKKIGDEVVISQDGFKQDYIITGLFSTGNSLAQQVLLSLDGYRMIDRDYTRKNISVYLNEGADTSAFEEELMREFGRETDAKTAKEKAIEKITSWRRNMESVFIPVVFTLKIVFLFVIAFSAVILFLSLHMTVNNILTGRRIEMGVLKAGGFTSKQLILQTALSFTPMTVLFSVSGSILGALAASPAIQAGFSKSGLYGLKLPVNPFAICAICVSVIALSFIFSFITAMSIKDITPYELLSE